MIVTALINLFALIMNAASAARPAWAFTIPASVYQTMSFLFGMDNILPVSEACLCMVASVTMLTALVSVKGGVKLMDWVADILP